MASLSTCHLGLWLGWQILLNHDAFHFQDEVVPVIFDSDHCAVLNFYFANRFLAPHKSCLTCFIDMKLVPHAQLRNRYAWHCKNCHSEREDSSFMETCLLLQKDVHVIYLWAENLPVKTAAEILGVSRQCVQQHFPRLGATGCHLGHRPHGFGFG